METGMWENAATRDNVATLGARGFSFVGPEAGGLASGRSGVGRMAEPEAIVERAEALLRPRDLLGVCVVITAGPTWEAIDPVRVLSNRSTGSMGIEIARAAAERGAHVSLILGPTQLSPPEGPSIETVRVESAEEMLAAGTKVLGGAAVLIASAAVSDFRPEKSRAKKLKRSEPGARALALEENPDVLASLSQAMRSRPNGHGSVIVGFAAETENLEQNARDKLIKKGCDLVIANLVGKHAGFGADSTEVLAVPRPERGAPIPFGPASKRDVAQFVLDQVLCLRKQQSSG
jgi:phosphopantothenoylcysteine decarboxylase/phosphopantothenate--cysteine ligase